MFLPSSELNPQDELVSIPVACELTGVSRRTIYNWISGNKIDWCRNAGGSVRILRSSLFRSHDKDDLVSNEREAV